MTGSADGFFFIDKEHSPSGSLESLPNSSAVVRGSTGMFLVFPVVDIALLIIHLTDLIFRLEDDKISELFN